MNFEKPTPNKGSELTNSLKKYIEIAAVPEELKRALNSTIDKANDNRGSGPEMVGSVADACEQFLPNLSRVDDMWKLGQAYDEGLSDEGKTIYSLFQELRTYLIDNRKERF